MRLKLSGAKKNVIKKLNQSICLSSQIISAVFYFFKYCCAQRFSRDNILIVLNCGLIYCMHFELQGFYERGDRDK